MLLGLAASAGVTCAFCPAKLVLPVAVTAQVLTLAACATQPIQGSLRTVIGTVLIGIGVLAVGSGSANLVDGDVLAFAALSGLGAGLIILGMATQAAQLTVIGFALIFDGAALIIVGVAGLNAGGTSSGMAAMGAGTTAMLLGVAALNGGQMF